MTKTISPAILAIVALSSLAVACAPAYQPGDSAGGNVAQDGVAADGGIADTGGGSSGGGVDSGGAVDTGGGAVDTGSPTDTSQDTGNPTSPTSPLVSPNCVDGKYQETLPTGSQNISDLVSGYDKSQYMSFITTALERRYPFGKSLVVDAIASAPQNCVDVFLPASFRTSASQVLSRMGVIVHECGHFYDLYKKGKGFGSSHYQITGDVAFTCAGAGYKGSNKTFARSLIKGDKWASANTPCNNFGEQGCDSYAAIYLNGDPTDSKFDSGDQGFNMLFEEVVQYVNSLAEAVAFRDQIKGSTSARDGILTFLWYTTRYLQMARLKYPDAYKVLSQDKCWREAILTVWGRAWLYLEATKGDNKLTIKGDKLLKNATEPDLVNEIELLRKIQGCQ